MDDTEETLKKKQQAKKAMEASWKLIDTHFEHHRVLAYHPNPIEVIDPQYLAWLLKQVYGELCYRRGNAELDKMSGRN